MVYVPVTSAQSTPFLGDTNTRVEPNRQVNKGAEEMLKPGVQRPYRNKSGYLLASVFLLGIFGLIRFFQGKHISDLNWILVKTKLGRMKSELPIKHEILSFFLVLFFFLCSTFILSYFLYYFYPALYHSFPAWKIFSLLLTLIFLSFFVKWMIIRMLAWIFKFQKVVHSYQKHLYYIHQLAGYFLIPLCALMILPNARTSMTVTVISGFVLGSVLIFKYLLNFAYVKKLKEINGIQIFIYLCALEILPVAILIRFLMDNL